MKEIVTFAFESIAVGAVLTATYTLLLSGRVQFRKCRQWLFASVVLMGVVPMVEIPVWPARIVELAPLTVPQLPVEGGISATAAPTINLGSIAMVLYILGALFIAGIIVRQWIMIRRLRRDAEISQREDMTLVSTRRRISSFSFLKSIYMWRDTPAEDVPQILAHECSHIAHHHTVERIAVELMKALMWWNPFAWIAARQLVEVEEFEADEDVLSRGWEREEYMQTIFRQMMGYSPEIASSLRDSLTKKRFKMMTEKSKSRYARLRMAAALPILLGIVCAFSFTTQATEYRTAAKQEPQPEQEITKMTLSGLEGKIISINGKDAKEVKEKPLYIVDGQERERMDDIPSSSVLSVQIHKDAETIAKYGDKAKHGVVFIITKPTAGDRNPLFRGEELQAFQTWVAQNVRYPEEAAKKLIDGTVYVKFAIDEKGEVVDVEILKSPHELLSEEVLRVVKSSPEGAWTPGTKDGKAVKVQMTIPVLFSLNSLSEAIKPWSREQAEAFRKSLEDLRAVLGDRPEIVLSDGEAWLALGGVDVEQLAGLSSWEGSGGLEKLKEMGKLVKLGEWHSEKPAEKQ